MTAPNTPDQLTQLTLADISIPLGQNVASSSVILRARFIDPDNNDGQIEFELKPNGTAFDGTGTFLSAVVSSNSQATKQYDSLSDGAYHWRCRAVDTNAEMSAWEEFGENSFVISSDAYRNLIIADGATTYYTADNLSSGGGHTNNIIVAETTPAPQAPNLSSSGGYTAKSVQGPIGTKNGIQCVSGDGDDWVGSTFTALSGDTWSFDFWFKYDQHQSGIPSLYESYGNIAIQMYSGTVASRDTLRVHCGSNNTDFIDGIILDGQWHHYLVRTSGANIDFLRDGSYIESGTRYSLNASSASCRVAFNGDNGNRLDGSWDEIALYNGTSLLNELAESHYSIGANGIADLSPYAPTNLDQRVPSPDYQITAGEEIWLSSVILSAYYSDPDNNDGQIEFELKPNGTAFDGTGTFLSTVVSSGTIAVKQYDGLSDGSYHWRCRSIDSNTNQSSWSIHDDGDNSFSIDTTGKYISPRARIVASNPFHYWNAGSTDGLLEDIGSAGNDLTNNNAIATIGRADTIAHFFPSGQTAQLTSSDTDIPIIPADSSDWSFFMIAKFPTGYSPSEEWILSADVVGGNQNILVRVQGGNINLLSGAEQISIPMTADGYYHSYFVNFHTEALEGVCVGYRDGVEVVRDNETAMKPFSVQGGSRIHISGSAAGGYCLNGAYIDDLATFNSFVSASEYRTWHNSSFGLSAIPSNIIAIGSTGRASVSWSSGIVADSYNIYYSTSPGVTIETGTKVNGVTSPATISGLDNGTPIYFVVTSVLAGIESDESEEVSTIPLAIPSNPIASSLDGAVQISWSPVAGATGYNIYHSTSSGVTIETGTKVAGVTSPATINGLLGGTTIYAVVTATGSESDESEEVSATATPYLSSLTQKTESGISITNGGKILVQNIHLGATTTDNTTSRIEVEVKPVASLFDGTGTSLGNVVSGTGISTASIFANVLGEYKWRARSVDNLSNVSEWIEFPAAPIDFEVVDSIPVPPIEGLLGPWFTINGSINEVPGAPEILTPLSSDEFAEGQTIIATWNQAIDPDGNPLRYSVQWSNDGGMTWNDFDGLTGGLTEIGASSATVVIPEGEAGTWTVRVRAWDGLSFGGADSVSFDVVSDFAPTAPVVIDPSEGSLINANESFNVNWEAATDPNHSSNDLKYEIQFSNGGAWTNAPNLTYDAIADAWLTSSGAVTHSVPANTLSEGNWTVRVRAWDGEMWGPYDSNSFSAFGVSAPVITAPVAGQWIALSDTAIDVSWTSASESAPPGSVSYEVRWHNSGNPSGVLVDTTQNLSTVVDLSSYPALNVEGNSYITVTPIISGNNGPIGTSGTFGVTLPRVTIVSLSRSKISDKTGRDQTILTWKCRLDGDFVIKLNGDPGDQNTGFTPTTNHGTANVSGSCASMVNEITTFGGQDLVDYGLSDGTVLFAIFVTDAFGNVTPEED